MFHLNRLDVLFLFFLSFLRFFSMAIVVELDVNGFLWEPGTASVMCRIFPSQDIGCLLHYDSSG